MAKKLKWKRGQEEEGSGPLQTASPLAVRELEYNEKKKKNAKQSLQRSVAEPEKHIFTLCIKDNLYTWSRHIIKIEEDGV